VKLLEPLPYDASLAMKPILTLITALPFAPLPALHATKAEHPALQCP
jgi:hypothetical protein